MPKTCFKDLNNSNVAKFKMHVLKISSEFSETVYSTIPCELKSLNYSFTLNFYIFHGIFPKICFFVLKLRVLRSVISPSSALESLLLHIDSALASLQGKITRILFNCFSHLSRESHASQIFRESRVSSEGKNREKKLIKIHHGNLSTFKFYASLFCFIESFPSLLISPHR